MALGIDKIDDLHAELELQWHDACLLGELGGGVRFRRRRHRSLGVLVGGHIGHIEGQPAPEHEEHDADEQEGQLG